MSGRAVVHAAHFSVYLEQVADAAYVDRRERVDLRNPKAILSDPDLAKLIDFDQPVAVLLVAVLHLMADDDDPAGIVAQLLAPACSGSYLALSHLGRDFNEERQMAVS